MIRVIDERPSSDVNVDKEYVESEPYKANTEESKQPPKESKQPPRQQLKPGESLHNNNFLDPYLASTSRKDSPPVQSPEEVVQPVQGQAKSKDALGRLAMRETYDGVVVEAFSDTAVVIYDVGEDRVEQTYDQDQFVGGCLPAEGTRLRVQVEVFELPTDESEDFDDEKVELTDESIARGPEKLTEPTEF